MLLRVLDVRKNDAVAYMVFRDIEDVSVTVLKSERAAAMANSGNLGIYNAVNSRGEVCIDDKRVTGVYKASLQTAQNANYLVAPLDAGWLALGVPCLTGVCLLRDKSTKTVYVWCKVFVTEKAAQNTVNFFTTAAEVLSAKFEENAVVEQQASYSNGGKLTDEVFCGAKAVTQMSVFNVTTDNKYAYCDCVMISYDALIYLMSDEGRKAFEYAGGLAYRNFMLNVEHLKRFDYRGAKRISERPAGLNSLIADLETTVRANNVRVVTEIKNAVKKDIKIAESVGKVKRAVNMSAAVM